MACNTATQGPEECWYDSPVLVLGSTATSNELVLIAIAAVWAAQKPFTAMLRQKARGSAALKLLPSAPRVTLPLVIYMSFDARPW